MHVSHWIWTQLQPFSGARSLVLLVFIQLYLQTPGCNCCPALLSAGVLPISV